MKRIIAFTIALFLVISFFAVTFSVSADETAMTNQEYYAAQSYLIAKYKDGKISYSEFQQQTQAVTDEFVSKNTVGGVLQAGALNASNTVAAVSEKIGSTVQKYGESARDYINDYISDLFNSYTVLSDKPTTDLKGYGAVVESTLINTPTYANGSDDSTYRQLESCDYVVILGNGSYRLCSSNGTYLNEFYTYFDGHLHMSTSFETSVKFRSEYRTYKFYGDIRYEDGTQAPTDDTYETISDYDFSDASDKELEDLLKKILNELELKEPDLSTMEGLLKAIYARLGTLDSDNDNELLSSINSAVLALVKSNDDNSEALLEELLKFREDLKNGTVGTDTVSHGHEISGTLYNVIPLDKNWLNKIFHDKENLKVQYEGKTYYLEDCGCLKLDNKFYSVDMNYDSYSKFDYDFGNENDDIDHIVKLSDENASIFDVDFGSINDFMPSQNTRKNTRKQNISTFSLSGEQAFFDNVLTRSQKDKVNGAVELIQGYVNLGVPFESLRDNFSVYEEIIFNNYLPRDLKFTFFDTDVVLLRYSDFINDSGNETTSYTEAVNIVRALSSILISFYWVFSMYKKVSNLI